MVTITGEHKVGSFYMSCEVYCCYYSNCSYLAMVGVSSTANQNKVLPYTGKRVYCSVSLLCLIVQSFCGTIFPHKISKYNFIHDPGRL